MSKLFPFVPALAGGIGLGIFYFGGLWLTIQYLPDTRRPGVLTLGSFLVRMGVILTGFYLLMDGQWERLLICLVGFLGTRNFLVHHYQPTPHLFSNREER